MKPYYKDDSVTIYHGDCREIVPTLGKFDLLLTDPPYGETSLIWDRWPDNWPRQFAASADLLWVFGSMRMFLEKASDFIDWKFCQDVVWEKQNGSGLHADRFRRVHENAVLFYQGKWEGKFHSPVMTMDAMRRNVKRAGKPQHWGAIKARSKYFSAENGPRLMRSVIKARNCHMKAVHPTQKPTEILTPLIQYSTPSGANILDPFAGSGSTGRAAKDLGRKATLIEREEKYCEIAAMRMSQGVLIT